MGFMRSLKSCLAYIWLNKVVHVQHVAIKKEQIIMDELPIV